MAARPSSKPGPQTNELSGKPRPNRACWAGLDSAWRSPARDDLENVKLGCWTLLFLKSVLPDWAQLETWIQECGVKVTGQTSPIETPLGGYIVACQFLRHPSLIEYRLAQAA